MADQKMERMKELVTRLRAASRAYYQESRELMSNYEYDSLYDELTALEKETGTVLAGSPTVNVGYEVVSELPKERHEQPMLSLDKTKSVEELAAFAGEHRSLLSWKLDGLTIVLTYRDGALFKAVTRGNEMCIRDRACRSVAARAAPISIPRENLTARLWHSARAL